MRISLLFLGTTGAGPVYSFEMAKALAHSGKCELQVILAKQSTNLDVWHKEFDNTRVEIVEVDTYRHTPLHLGLSYLQFWKHNRIINAIRDFKADVLYSPFVFPWAPVIFPKVHGIARIVSTQHDPHPHNSTRNPFTMFWYKLMQSSYKYIDDLIILNKKDVEFAKSYYCPNVHVIPHASFSYYAQMGNNRENNGLRKTIGFIGRISPYKGLDLLVDAYSKITTPGISLLIAGSGTIDSDLLEKINGNPNIELINRYIEDDEFTTLLDRIDFVVLPYKRASQSGVIPMAFAYGKTVIATKVGALEEQVPNGTGVLVEPTADAVANAIDGLYLNPEALQHYGENAKEYAETELTWEHSAELLLGML